MYDLFSHYRAFIAVTPSREAKEYLRDINRELKNFSRNFKFVAIDQLHITLQFLGDSVSGQSISQIEKRLSLITRTQQPFNITIDRLSFGFPAQNIASLLYYNLVDDYDLRDFTLNLHNSLKTLGLNDIKRKKDHAKLIHHLSIARTKHDMSRSFTKEVNEFISTLNIKPITFEVQGIQIVSSIFKNNKTTYNILVEFPFHIDHSIPIQVK